MPKSQFGEERRFGECLPILGSPRSTMKTSMRPRGAVNILFRVQASRAEGSDPPPALGRKQTNGNRPPSCPRANNENSPNGWPISCPGQTMKIIRTQWSISCPWANNGRKTKTGKSQPSDPKNEGGEQQNLCPKVSFVKCRTLIWWKVSKVQLLPTGRK